jgi:hypothetical protein
MANGPFAAQIQAALRSFSLGAITGYLARVGSTLSPVNTGDSLNLGTGTLVAGASILQGLTISRGAGTGANSTALGYNALAAATSGEGNTAVGNRALTSVTTGGYNTAVGLFAAFNVLDGTNNTAVGTSALRVNTSGSLNTAVGSEALYSNTTGGSNTAVGNNTHYSGRTGLYNAALGAYALYGNTSGSNNSTVGYSALLNNITGSRNVALGNMAGRYWTGSDRLYIDNQDRTNTAGDDAKSLIVGVFDATAANQSLRINGSFSTLGSIQGLLSITAHGILTGNLTFVSTDTTYHTANPNGTNRDVNLPATPATGLPYYIKNVGVAGDLVVKDSGGATVITLASDDSANVVYDGTSWVIL